jgi:hypothetical protein
MLGEISSFQMMGAPIFLASLKEINNIKR